MTRRRIIGTTLTVLFLLSLLIIAIGNKITAVAKVSDKELTPGDEAQIMSVIQQWYDLRFEASINGGDVSRFPEVLLDTPDYPLDDEHQQYIVNILGSNAVQDAGFLTAKQAQYKNLGEGWALLKIAINKAEQENRDITHAELDEIVKKIHGEIPPIVDENYSEPTLTLESADLIRADKAIVCIFDGIRHNEYILIKVGDKWFIASGKTKKVDN